MRKRAKEEKNPPLPAVGRTRELAAMTDNAHVGWTSSGQCSPRGSTTDVSPAACNAGWRPSSKRRLPPCTARRRRRPIDISPPGQCTSRFHSRSSTSRDAVGVSRVRNRQFSSRKSWPLKRVGS
jgi:hypothetical protein